MKRTKLHLASNLSFGTDIITEVIDVIAKRGAGKTYTAMKLAEEMLIVGAQVVAIDPVGNWYGLRLGANGKPAEGLDIKILGGRNGDIPLEHTAGALVAKTIVETGMSAILDLSHLAKIKQQRFITEFAAALLEFRKRAPAAMHIFWEEAYRFMPQKMSKGSKNEMLEATEELVTMGRNFGIGGTIICQRAAQISKTVLTQASILIAMNTTGLTDKKVIEAWIDFHSAPNLDSGALSKLKKGEAIIWWPEEFGLKRVKVSKKKTYDASSTPKFGEKTRKRKLKAINLAALEVSMAETIEKAKNEDPRLLRRRIAELEKKLAARKETPAETIVEKVVEVPVMKDSTLEQLKRSVVDLQKLANEISAVASSAPQVKKRTERLAPARKLAARPATRSPAKPAPFMTDADFRLPRGAMAMLKALAAISPGGLTKKQVALGAGMKSSGGTFGTYWSKLNIAKFIKEKNRNWYITEEGMGFLGDDIPTQPDSPEEKIDFWCERVPGKAKEMLRHLFLYHDQEFSKLELGDALGMEHTGGTFGTYLSKLTSNNLVVKTSLGYKISEDMFS